MAYWHNRPHWPTFAAFDLDMLTPQSFASLVLEVWASELKDLDSSRARASFPACRHSFNGNSEDVGLYEMLGQQAKDGCLTPLALDHRLALFRAWMLLAEVLDARELTTDMHRLASRPSPFAAIAERHWYSTGSLAWKQVGGDNPVIPAQLPGSFTTRGDWFLMVGRESRSHRLGERAIDLICRRRGNVERLELGLGLPVRRLNRESWSKAARTVAYEESLTAMANFERGGRRRIVRYGDFLELGSLRPEKFQWLWRSRLRDYHKHDRVWEKWLGRVLVEACKRAGEIRSELQVEPFAAYDFITGVHSVLHPGDQFKDERTRILKGQLAKEDRHIPPCPGAATDARAEKLWSRITHAWWKFNSRCDSLVSELSQLPSTRADDPGPAKGQHANSST